MLEPAPTATLGPRLLEREQDLARLDDAIQDALTGTGRVIVIEGEAGIGKSTLARDAGTRGTDAGAETLYASGGRFESALAFGVARQLFEPPLRRRSEAERRELLSGAASGALTALGIEASATTGATHILPALHGLYWLASNLTERVPVVAVVDDAHLADPESLRWLLYLAHRVSDLPLLLVVAYRPDELDPAVAAELSTGHSVVTIRPQPLSAAASARVVRELRGEGAADAFCAACHAATGGNPFYLRELVRETEAQQMLPDATAAPRVSGLGPRTIAAATTTRLAELGALAANLAEAVVVLGLDVDLRDAAALIDADAHDAGVAADALAAAGILRPQRPLNFAHPVLASAIATSIPLSRTSAMHERAARLLADQGAAPAMVASHLLEVEGAGDVWAMGQLERAADDALERGAAATAAVYLRRALRESSSGSARVRALRRLGQAEMIGGDPAAVAHLQEALERAGSAREAAEAAFPLCSVLMTSGRLDEAIAAGRRGVDEARTTGDQELVLKLQGQLATVTTLLAPFAQTAHRELPKMVMDAASTSHNAPLLYVSRALQLATGLEGHSEVPELLDTALRPGSGFTEETSESLAAGNALCALAMIDRFDAAEGLLSALLTNARTRGSVMAYVGALVWRGWMALRRGQVAAAESDERMALELAARHGLRFPMPWAVTFLASALVERGQIAEATALIEAPEFEFDIGDALAGIALITRGQVRIAAGDRQGGIADLQLGGQRHEAIGVANPNITHWRSKLALALEPSDPRALPLAEEELRRARVVGLPRAEGVALRALGLLEPGEAAIPILAAAASALEHSEARLEHVRALVALGAATRRTGQRRAARAHLAEALDAADRLGATALAEEARAELASCGARPRRRRLTGVEALTPTELRVAHMASSGMSNVEIAQSLFVSRKTIEMHLGNTYRKLDVRGRGELGAKLDLSPAIAQVVDHEARARERRLIEVDLEVGD